MSQTSSYGIHWFRRDLRISGNPGLRALLKKHPGRVVGLFCIDPGILQRSDIGWPRFLFFLKTLEKLQELMREMGGDLRVIEGAPDRAIPALLSELKKGKVGLPVSFSFCRDYEPYAAVRDTKVQELLRQEFGIEAETERDHLLIEPHEIRKGEGETPFYQVYSPYARRWFDLLATPEGQSRVQAQAKGMKWLSGLAQGKAPEKVFELTWANLFSQRPERLPEDVLLRVMAQTAKKVSIELPEAGELAAYRRLLAFKEHVDAYGETRDLPGVDGTSRLSYYLKNGSLTSSGIISVLGLETARFKAEGGQTKYLKEIAWREFYYSILANFPRVENEAFLVRYKDLEWENRKDLFQAWCEGRTGYPIVDAAMRQMNQTGWMHNRLRMIVASFLTKDLLIDWKWGERYFMEKLLDGDLAPNNGGWQWAASTGVDPQPYFRIFNPKLQSERYDEDGEFIRTFVPELKGLGKKDIHEPSEKSRPAGYPAPIVDHASQKIKALQLYKI